MSTGAMIAHFMPDQVAKQLSGIAQDHFGDRAEKPEDMHLTLAYLGEAADLGDDDPMELANILEGLSGRLSPVSGSINGVGRFMDGDPHAVVANCDIPGLATLRRFLLLEARGAGIEPVVNHGFTPHVTLAYVPSDQETPDIRFDPIPVVLNAITLALGDERKIFPLRGDISLSEAKHMAKLHESGVYDVSVSELQQYSDGLSESVPKDAPESDFASPPRGLYVGDAKHAALAVQAVTGGLEGNVAKDKSKPGVKSKIEAAVRKFYKGKMQQYYLSWLHTGKKPEKRPTSEMQYIVAPAYTMADEARFPDVPPAPGVDIAALTAGDPNPVFVTRPLAILGAVSENGLLYNEAVFNDVLQQVLTKRPVARRGHISEEDKSSLFPPDEGYWIGAVQDTSFYGKPAVFGKCYAVPGELRDMVLRRRATGTALSNSLWGDVTTTEDEMGNVIPLGVEIESIDFVPEERAALQALGGDFLVTSEMKKGMKEMAEGHADAAADLELFKKAVASIDPSRLHEMLQEMGHAHHIAESHLKAHEAKGCSMGEVHEMMSESQRQSVAEAHVREASPEETYKMMSEAQRSHCAECYAKETGRTLAEAKALEEAKEESKKAMEETKKVSEMTQSLSEMNKRVAEMERTIKGYQRADFERALDARIDSYFVAEVRTEKGKEVVASLKRQMRKNALVEMVGMDGGQTIDNINAACDKDWEGGTKSLTEMAYAGMAGPGVVIGQPKVNNGKEFRTGIDPATGFFGADFMQTAKAAAAGAGRPQKRGAK